MSFVYCGAGAGASAAGGAEPLSAGGGALLLVSAPPEASPVDVQPAAPIPATSAAAIIRVFRIP